MIRIAVTGPESTGKSTLSEALAKHFNCPWVPEYAREFLTQTNGYYEQQDLDTIAQGQLKLWEEQVREPLCIYDTEMLVIKIWSSFKYGEVSDLIENAFQSQKIDLYLLCKPDIDWEEDELREHPELREELFEMYLEGLKINNLPCFIVEGEGEERLLSAIKSVNKLI
jgi:NadR type nicotinamide-nucleotide adenylyltransferase